uniref:Uncharacterized protein n=1 Tax=Anopheles minimus TaxID=112268 RepID=A0A182WPP6_9DIPT
MQDKQTKKGTNRKGEITPNAILKYIIQIARERERERERKREYSRRQNLFPEPKLPYALNSSTLCANQCYGPKTFPSIGMVSVWKEKWASVNGKCQLFFSITQKAKPYTHSPYTKETNVCAYGISEHTLQH